MLTAVTSNLTLAGSERENTLTLFRLFFDGQLMTNA